MALSWLLGKFVSYKFGMIFFEAPLEFAASLEIHPNLDQFIRIEEGQKTKNASVYIIGSINTISSEVEREIQSLNVKFLDRISGNTPYDIAVNFAKYKSPTGAFGWGRTEREGHAFTFTSVLSPFDSVCHNFRKYRVAWYLLLLCLLVL